MRILRKDPSDKRWQRLRRGLAVVTSAVIVLSAQLQLTSASAQTTAGWTTSGTEILTPAGGRFAITGINWYGFETRNNVAHGLWAQDYKFIVDQVKQYGYNTIRIPFSNSMWEGNPTPNANVISACPECKGKHARDIMALIVNYAGSIGLRVILDNHRSTTGNSAESNGLWYTSGFPESAWIRDWRSVQQWVHGITQTLGATDTVTVNYLASDGFPTVLGYDLRNEPHSPSTRSDSQYDNGANWGTGDGIDPAVNPNPNPFAPACVATSTCHDWRLAAERGADMLLGDAAANGWDYPLFFVEGVGLYPANGGSHATGPYEGYWWGGNLLGVNGNSSNAGAPIVLNAGGSASGLGEPVYNQVVYSAHDYGPSLFQQSWFNSGTCYTSGCGSSSLADVWTKYWAHLNLSGGIDPVWPGHSSYPWGNTGHIGYSQAPVFIGEFGTGNIDSDLHDTARGSQGQWFTDIVNFIESSHGKTTSNDSGVPVTSLHWTYWALNEEDDYALLGAGFTGLENPNKEYSFLCFIQQPPFAIPHGSGEGQCGSTGPLPSPF